MDRNNYEKIHSFRVYSAGEVIGAGDTLSLPSVDSKTVTVSGAGILGEYESPAEGHVDSMEQEIPFNTMSPEYFDFIEKVNSGADITIRAALQFKDAATQTLDTKAIKITERGSVKGFAPGEIKNADVMGSTVTINLTYLKIEIDGKEKLEIDRLNMIYKVNGVDRLKKIREQC